MESLYRKYRPQTFADVVGQQHVVSTLEHAVLEGRTSHAYLFCGPRGTGKTTMARLLAKALLCEQGPRRLPCGVCEQCAQIAAGDHPDVYELDAASRTGVDNVREEIITRVDYAPVRGRYKVYIIDEVHMLTVQAFNALLKTLEEPPAHVVFVLCTTDPQKIPATILSRVQRFDFHAISAADIERHLESVCEQEGFTYDAAALELVCRHARGGMRDALSTLEQLSVFGDGVISADAARDLLGEVSASTLGAVSSAIARRDVAALFGKVAELVDSGRDLLQFTRELAAHVRDLYVVSAVGAAEGVVQATCEELAALQAEVADFGSPDRLARVLTILGDASMEMRTATNQRLVLEIAFTRMARPSGELTLEALAERIAALEAGAPRVAAPVVQPMAPASQMAPVPEPVAAPVPAPAPLPAQRPTPAPGPQRQVPQTAPAPQRPAPQPMPPTPAPQPQSAPRPAPRPAPQPEPAPQPQPAAQPASAANTGGALQRKWRQVVDGLVAKSPSYGSLLMNAVAATDDGAVIQVSLPPRSGFALRMLEREDVRAAMEPIVRDIFGVRAVKYVEGPVPPAPPRAEAPAPAPARAEAPAPVPQPAPRPQTAPTPQPQPQPAPQPAPRQQPAPQLAPQPQPTPRPQQPAPRPAPRPQPAPAAVPSYVDDRVPYEDFDIPAYDDVYDDGYGNAPAAPQPAPRAAQPLPRPAAQQRPAQVPDLPWNEPAAPAPAPQPEPAPQPAPVPRPAPRPEPAAPAPAPQPREVRPPALDLGRPQADDVDAVGVPEPPLPPAPPVASDDDQLVPQALAAMLEEVFGAPVPVERIGAERADADRDADEEFAEDGLDGGIAALEEMDDDYDDDDE